MSRRFQFDVHQPPLRQRFAHPPNYSRSIKIKGTILRAEKARVHSMLVVGQKEQEANTVTARVHAKGNLGAKPEEEAVVEILRAIRGRSG